MKILGKLCFLVLLISLFVISTTSYGKTIETTNEIVNSDIYYILNFDANTSDLVKNLPANIEADIGKTITIPNQIPTRAGYTFSGWNTFPDGSGAQYQPNDYFGELYQDTTLYAQWKEADNSIIIIVIMIPLLTFFIGITIFTLYYNYC